MLTLKAYAKINLTLDVLEKHIDSYHEILTVMQTVDLADILTFEVADNISVFSENHAEVTDNSILKSAKLLQTASGVQTGAVIKFIKKIPVASGLGGGSSDAAATLKGLNSLWNLNWSVERLTGLAAELGSDVTFFLYKGTALAKGRGERIVQLPDFPTGKIAILKPPFNIQSKTKTLYEKLDEENICTSGRATRRLVRNSYVQGRIVSARYIYNIFEQVADKVFPGINEYKRIFSDAGASNVHLCGAGPALFSLEYDSEAAVKIYQSLIARGLEAYLTQTVAADYKEQ
ncbi:MAG: 4-(cytidine 5'-diphospho)-2-C-methyl-D-erythritol kinase [Chloroflexi bacterium]|nr:4-(cytidine 5'-diphospho)-2-C-methyl-D-erythritol kinase [Chloroflexota bacterium]